MEQPPETAEQPKIGINPRNGMPMPIGKRWPKGTTGNPEGRRLSSEMDAQLVDETVQGLVSALIQKALDGDSRAQEIIWERHEGKLTQKVENDNRQTIVIEHGMDETPP